MLPQEVKQLLISAGWIPNSEVLSYSLAQCAFECGSLNFNSPVEEADNNLTGIVYACDANGNHFSWQKNCTKGIAKPQGEQAGFYAKFNTLEDWAVDYHRIVHAQFLWNKIGRPIDATSLIDYAQRLKANSYFEGDEAVYAEGLQKYLTELQKLGVC